MRRLSRHLARALRLSAVATLAVTLWLLWQTPPAQYFREATAPEVRLAVDRLSGRTFDQAWLDGTITGALSETPVNWPLIESATAFATARDMTPSPEVARSLNGAQTTRASATARASNCIACASGDPTCQMSNDGLACALGVELTPIGDVRVLLREGQAYADGAPVDNISVALAGIGLGATAAILVSGGSTATVKGGVALTRVARRAGHLSPALQARLAHLGHRAIDWSKLPKTAVQAFDPAVYRAAVRGRVLAQGADLAADLDRMRQAMPASHALRLLGRIDTAQDARRMAKLSTGAGARSLAVVHRLGKTRAFRLTLRLSRVGRTLAGLAIALAVQALGLLLVRAQTLLARLIARLA
ncbi:MAG: hypothetical protein AAF245_04670 [Pseudomonadota bacterium]